MTTVGAAASAGSGTAALLNDSAPLGESTVTAGVVDLETDPSWGNDGSLGTISKERSGTETIDITLSDNPSHVWFRTDCKQCVDVEDAVYVQYGVDTDGDDGAEIDITDGYIPLGEARERFGTGYHLGRLDPSETWTLIAEWKLQEHIKGTDIPLSFDFYAAQTRHVSGPDDIRLPWSCEDCDVSTTKLSDISWVAFCGDTFETDFTPELKDEHTLLLDTVPDGIETISVKYGQALEVFSTDEQWPSSLTVGQGDGQVFQHTGKNDYANTQRSSSNFCDGADGCKFNFDDGVWEPTEDAKRGPPHKSVTRPPDDDVGGEH